MSQQRLFSLMKNLLPRSVSFRLRYVKSEIVDTEMHALKKIAACLGGKDQYAIDVGANWGIYSRALSKKFDQVLCIEPNPACAQYLRSVLAVNCTVIDAAASNKDEYRNLRVPVSANTAETTRGTISERNTFDGLDVVTVQENRVHCIRLDEAATGLVTGPGRVALIKVDVEGHELEAVQGAEGILKRHKPVLFVELEERHGTRTAELRELTAQYGYKTYVFADDRTHSAASSGSAKPAADGGAVNVIFMAETVEQAAQQARLKPLLVPLV
ncbi:FkbM family methyltransferase [Methylobacterium sp. GXS13]|uniref:FkbM family methyltransferase n=1 Tax=Methylobacterium sp. GXS13 TaxID=1730094 RepID=UPI0009E7945C|nr:FkbM family methyltransferase [Methylobacterium sp. GXS13]